MSEMVERVGEALRVKLIEWYAGAISFEDGGPMLARAAIEAMREPTDVMMERAVPAATISIDRGPVLNREAQQQAEDFAAPRRRDAANIYRNMIQAALGNG